MGSDMTHHCMREPTGGNAGWIWRGCLSRPVSVALSGMKLSISTLVCPNWSLPQIVGAAAASGVQGIDPRGIGTEIDITKLPEFDAELDATLTLLADHGLSMPCFNTSVSLVTPAPERWQMMLDECQRYAKLAGRTGTKYLRIFGGATPKGMSDDEAMILAIRHLRQLIRICGLQNCQILVETHDAWVGSERLLQLLAEFDPAEAGVLWDMEHPYRHGEAPLATAEALRHYLRHIHLKDSTRLEGKNRPRLLGAGELPLKDFIAALHAIGYDQWICLETEKRWHAETAPEPEQSIPQFVQFMRENW